MVSILSIVFTNSINNKPEEIDKDIETFFGTHGFNGFHTYVFCRGFDINQTKYDNIRSNDPNPDPRTFEALELLITKTHAAGGLFHIWAWGDEQRHMTPIKWGKNGTDVHGYQSRLSPDCRFLVVDDLRIVRITPETPRPEYEVPGRILGFLPDDEGVVFEKYLRRFVLSLNQEDEPKDRELSEKKTSSVIKEHLRPTQAGDWIISLRGRKLSAKNSNIGQKVQLIITSGRLRRWKKESHRLFVDEIDAETKKSVGIVLLRADSKGGRTPRGIAGQLASRW